MNKTTPFEGAEDNRLFAKIITNVIEIKHREYERQHRELGRKRVPLANIHFGIVLTRIGDFAGIGDFYGNTGVPCLQEIAKIQGKPDENLLITAQRMLDLFEQIGEIEKKYINDCVVYNLHKDGLIYKDLADKLESIP